MQLQTFNLKTVFIGLLWFIVAICSVVSLYYTSYIQIFGYTHLRMWIDTAFYSAIAICTAVVAAGFSKRERRKRFYKKQLEILNLFTENSNQEKSISLAEILSRMSFSKSETKGLLEHLVEKNILIPSFSEEQELIYKPTDNGSLEKYLKKMK
jgi:ABC-type xylose transport system permease subunit